MPVICRGETVANSLVRHFCLRAGKFAIKTIKNGDKSRNHWSSVVLGCRLLVITLPPSLPPVCGTNGRATSLLYLPSDFSAVNWKLIALNAVFLTFSNANKLSIAASFQLLQLWNVPLESLISALSIDSFKHQLKSFHISSDPFCRYSTSVDPAVSWLLRSLSKLPIDWLISS